MNALCQNRILIVEDSPVFSSLLKRSIERELSCVALVEARGDVAVKRILDEQPDLVVLDRVLPGLDGLLVCQQVRPEYSGSILMISGLGDTHEQVEGLENGADDYIAKPARMELILAKVKTLLRRQNTKALQPIRSHSKHNSTVHDIDALVVDEENRFASLNGSTLTLTTFEFDLLALLASRAGTAVSRQELFKLLKSISWNKFDRCIDYHILNLRKKIDDNGKNPKIIKSIRGIGYLLVKKAIDSGSGN